jgi:hypothetical protein
MAGCSWGKIGSSGVRWGEIGEKWSRDGGDARGVNWITEGG